MEIFEILFTFLLGAAGVAFVLSVMAPQDAVQAFLENLMVFIQAPAAMLRDGAAAVLRRVWSWTQAAARSVGIEGPHWVQRLVGAAIIPAVSLLGIVVGTLNLMAIVGGIFGSAADAVLNAIPVPLELLTAAELMSAALLFGMLWLDTLGITHMTGYFAFEDDTSTEAQQGTGQGEDDRPGNIPWAKYTFAGIFALGTILSISLFGVSGMMRDALLFSGTEPALAAGGPSPPASPDGAIYEPGASPAYDAGAASDDAYDSGSLAAAPSSGRYEEMAGILLVAIPLISVTAGVFAGVGFISAGALLLVVPVLLLVGGIMGPIWVTGYFLARMVDLLYNLMLTIFGIFGGLGAALRGYMPGSGDEGAAYEPAAQPPQGGAPNPDPQSGSGQDLSPPSNTSAPAGGHDGPPPSGSQRPWGSSSGFPQEAGEAPPTPSAGQAEPPAEPQAEASNSAHEDTGSDMYGEDDPNWNPLAGG